MSHSQQGQRTIDSRAHNASIVPGWWQSSVEFVEDWLPRTVLTGTIDILGMSPGGRKVSLATFGGSGAEQPLGVCNWNSALGAGRPEAYFGFTPGTRRRPVLMVIAGMHGAEVEGIVGARSLIQILETGKDLKGNSQVELQRLLQSLRVLVVVMANPDGRARCPVEGWIGRSDREMSCVNHGTRLNGEPYGWPTCKATHPMRGDVGQLGTYFDDAGTNIMHDFWESPHSPVTIALLQRIAQEGPDCLMNLHSCEDGPMLLRTAYVPPEINRRIEAMNERLNRRLGEIGLPLSKIGGATGLDGDPSAPPAFNFNSIAYHTGAQLPFVFESPHGNTNWRFNGNYEDLLQLHHLSFEVVAQTLLEQPHHP